LRHAAATILFFRGRQGSFLGVVKNRTDFTYLLSYLSDVTHRCLALLDR